jgi:hypothetical protein
MTKNSNADNDYWELYKRNGRDFRGDPDDLEDMVTERENVRITRKKGQDSKRFVEE